MKENRKKVFSKLDEGLLEKADTLVIVEDIVYLQEFYSCAIYSDSLDYYFRARGLAEPQRINLMKEPLYIPELANYIFDKIKKGELEDILEQAKKRESYTPPSSMFITIVVRNTSDKNQFKVKEYKINRFVTREKLEERKRIRRRD